MKAAVLRELGAPLTVEDLVVPALSEGQVLVQMERAAVCHSQKLEVSGARGPDRYLPHLIGHEGVGLVVDTGSGVTKVKSGDQVVLSWIRGTGCGAAPISYPSSRGLVNAGPIATFCESPIVSEQCVVPIEPKVDPDVAVLAGCALPTGAGTVWNAMPSGPAHSICIFGMGGVGLSAVCGAVIAGWKQIVAVDMRPNRLQRALTAGATHTVNAAEEDVEAAAGKLTHGRGFDLVVECAGSANAMETAIRVATTRGGKIIIAGNLAAGKKINVDPFDLIKGRWLGGTWGGGIDPDRDIPRIIRMIEDGAIDHRLLIGKRFRLDQVNEALLALADEDPGRPVIEF